MTLQIGSKEHRRDGLTGETWKVDDGDFKKRAAVTQGVLQNLSHVLNSGEFITNDVDRNEKVEKEQALDQVKKYGRKWQKNPSVCAKSKTKILSAVVGPLW